MFEETPIEEKLDWGTNSANDNHSDVDNKIAESAGLNTGMYHTSHLHDDGDGHDAACYNHYKPSRQVAPLFLEPNTDNCYVAVSQVNSVSVSARLVTFPQMQTVVRDLTKHMPPCSLWISLPVISCINPSPSLPVTLACLMSMDFVTTPLYLMDSAFQEVASHGVTTQMTYFTTCLFQCTTCLFHVPCGTSVLLFLYLMRLISLVTQLFHFTLFKRRVLVCLGQFEISS